MDEKIKLSVDLFDNALTERKGDYVGRPRSTGSFVNSDIARRIIEKRTEYRQETIENILLLADQEKAKAIAEGKSVTDGVGNYQLRLIGSFEGPKAPFDFEKHELNVSYSIGKTLRSLLRSVVVETVPATIGAVINDVVDSATHAVNSVLTSGSTVIINGFNIKIAGDNPSVGVFLTKEGGAKTPVKLLVHNNPSQLTVLLPTLPEGKYTLSVVSQFGTGGKLLKEPRECVFPVPLTVEQEGNESESPDEV